MAVGEKGRVGEAEGGWLGGRRVEWGRGRGRGEA